ncbi:MAG: pyridoxamine 5'-phosphate oxidase family protein [Tannerellaceae bacterium]|nr:pyridoxamine 5'-phosphate oxidase family protein [Tannerellaceae bacterium]
MNTAYRSVIILGDAQLADKEDKIKALNGIVNKYTPHLSGILFPENMLKATAVIEITIREITGKYYK